MGLWAAIRNASLTQNIEAAFNAQDITSAVMKDAIREWLALYFAGDGTEQSDPCMRLPVTIVNKLYKTVFSEYDAAVSGAQAVFLQPLLTRLERVRKQAMQYALVGGEAFIKPVVHGNRMDFVLLRRDAFTPFERDAHGRITSVGSTEKSTVGGRYYTLAERRTVRSDGTLTIESRLYMSHSEDTLGSPVPLATLERYAEVQPVLELPGVYNLGMVPLRTPGLNTVDGSRDGVSVYDAAKGLIRNINRNEAQLNGEFDRGESRIIVSDDMLMQDDPETGKRRRKFVDHVFVGLDDDPDTTGITIFSPNLREASYFAREQHYLRAAENLIGLKRGILSEVEAAERTATEITSSAGDYNLTITDLQNEWERMLRELLATCVILGQLYRLTGAGKFDPESDVAVSWGDGVLFNRDKTWSELSGMVAAGLLKPELALAWYYDEPHDTEQDLQRIRAKYMPVMDALAAEE